jgi:hypothetical protein
MTRVRILHRRTASECPASRAFREPGPVAARLGNERGSALLEFAITLPLLVVFIVGIYDFSGAFNQKQKIEQAAQEGAIIAGAQPMSDIAPTGDPGPDSLQPVVAVIINSLGASGVLPLANQGTCKTPVAVFSTIGLSWRYRVSGCSGNPADHLNIVINRGVVTGGGGPPITVGTTIQVRYPYRWKFNSVIQLLIPGASYAAVTALTEEATVHNQL